MMDKIPCTTTELVKEKSKEQLKSFITHEIISTLDDVQEVRTKFEEDYRVYSNTSGQFVYLGIDISEKSEETLVRYTVYQSEEDFMLNPSLGKHPVYSDIHLRGPIHRTLPQVLTVLKNLS